MTYARDLPHDARDWIDRAACAQIGGDLWFAEDNHSRQQLKEAKAICHGCPVTDKCLADAMRVEADDVRTSVRYGVRGGLTGGQRAKLASKGWVA